MIKQTMYFFDNSPMEKWKCNIKWYPRGNFTLLKNQCHCWIIWSKPKLSEHCVLNVSSRQRSCVSLVAVWIAATLLWQWILAQKFFSSMSTWNQWQFTILRCCYCYSFHISPFLIVSHSFPRFPSFLCFGLSMWACMMRKSQYKNHTHTHIPKSKVIAHQHLAMAYGILSIVFGIYKSLGLSIYHRANDFHCISRKFLGGKMKEPGKSKTHWTREWESEGGGSKQASMLTSNI